MDNSMPRPVIAVVSEVLADVYNGTQLQSMFMKADVSDLSRGQFDSKHDFVMNWLIRCNEYEKDPLGILSTVLEDLMEQSNNEYRIARQNRVKFILKKHDLIFSNEGQILHIGSVGASQQLEQKLDEYDLASVNIEFARGMEMLYSDPPASITAACSILEALFKRIINDNGMEEPNDKSLKSLWKVISKNIQLVPDEDDEDFRTIIRGLSGVIDGIAGIRTKFGSAHGRKAEASNIEYRHARFANFAAHSIIVFILETLNSDYQSGQE